MLKNAVNLIVVDAVGKILCVTRRNTKIWCLPGGKVDEGETALEAVIRETREETGFSVLPDKCMPIYSDIVLGDDGNHYYSTTFAYLDVVQEDDPGTEWSVEPGIMVSMITADDLIRHGAFSEYNRNALISMQKLLLIISMNQF